LKPRIQWKEFSGGANSTIDFGLFLEISMAQTAAPPYQGISFSPRFTFSSSATSSFPSMLMLMIFFVPSLSHPFWPEKALSRNTSRKRVSDLVCSTSVLECVLCPFSLSD